MLGVMGTPNLPVNYKDSSSGKGVLFVGAKGQGAFQVGAPGALHVLLTLRLHMYSS